MFAHAETLMPFLVSLGLYEDQEPLKVNLNIKTIYYELNDLELFFLQLLSIVPKVRIKNGSILTRKLLWGIPIIPKASYRYPLRDFYFENQRSIFFFIKSCRVGLYHWISKKHKIYLKYDLLTLEKIVLLILGPNLMNLSFFAELQTAGSNLKEKIKEGLESVI